MDKLIMHRMLLRLIGSRFPHGEIKELSMFDDCCRLTLRDGRILLGRLDADKSLRLDEIDGVC